MLGPPEYKNLSLGYHTRICVLKCNINKIGVCHVSGVPTVTWDNGASSKI